MRIKCVNVGRDANTIKGELFGWFETGSEGTSPALQKDGTSSWDGFNLIDIGDYLIIKKNEKILFEGVIEGIRSEERAENTEIIFQDKEKNICANWARYPLNPKYGQLQLGGYWVHWLPTNIDLSLWYDILFTDETYIGVLKKKHLL